MIVYHEVAPESVHEILQEGIRCGANGEKTDASIEQADRYLDKCIPASLAVAQVSRRNNIYAYLIEGEHVVDIVEGERLSLAQFLAQSEQQVVALDVDPERCYVSDIDAFDALKQTLEKGSDVAELEELAARYWARLTPMPLYAVGSMGRPEVMITYDISPTYVNTLRGVGGSVLAGKE